MDKLTMAKRPVINPLCYVIERQYKNNLVIKNRLFKERLANARNLYRKDLLAHYGCVNAIEFSQEGELLVSGGDDRRVLLWSVSEALHGKGSPVVMQTNHISNIFCLGFNSNNTRIFSGGNDDQVIIHDINTGYLILKLTHRKPVYGLSVNPCNDDILATAGDDGRILIFDIRESPNSDALCLAKQKTGFHSVMFNPTNPRWLTTANSEEGIALWDYRKPREQLIHYDSKAGAISGISACFNSTGSTVLALRRRLPPVLYDTQKEHALCQFYHPQYYNSCTMKTCCFAGDNDEYVLSGSDDFNLYMWKVPEDDSEWGISHLVLKGHRSIVNQVRYNKQNNLIASSGVEKMVKLWSALPMGTWEGSLLREPTEPLRSLYTHEEYVYLVESGGERISHDYSEQCTQEDAKMMAFFDSLIQREIEGWNSPTDSDSDGQAQDYATLSNLMFLKVRSTIEENRKHKPNKIAQLIAKKKIHLARMAHAKSLSSIIRCSAKEKNKRRNGFHHKYKSSKHSKSNGLTKKSSKHPPMEKESRKHKFIPERSKPKKYRTRQSLKEICDSGTSNNSIDAPSTSTGITNSNSTSMFRVIEQDSEEDTPSNSNCIEVRDREENNFVNILPTPLNGTHDMYINVLEMSHDEVGHASTSSQTNRRSAACPRINYDECAVNSDSDSDFEVNFVTPVKKRRTVSASDSGFGTGPSSSKNYARSSKNSHQECSNASCSSDEELQYESFKKRVKKARFNLRKHIGVDSDSN